MSSESHFNYDSIADTYAGGVDDAPYNAHYERPAMFGVMPGVEGTRLLDAGCGGREWFGEFGAQRAQRFGIEHVVDDHCALANQGRVHVISARVRRKQFPTHPVIMPRKGGRMRAPMY